MSRLAAVACGVALLLVSFICSDDAGTWLAGIGIVAIVAVAFKLSIEFLPRMHHGLLRLFGVDG